MINYENFEENSENYYENYSENEIVEDNPKPNPNPKSKRKNEFTKGQLINLGEVCILRINEPQSLENSNYYRKKKYSVRIYYVKKNDTNKIRQNTIMFGNKKLKDFYETNSEKIKLRRQLQYYDFKENLFSPQFWCFHYLNGEISQEESLREIRRRFVIGSFAD